MTQVGEQGMLPKVPPGLTLPLLPLPGAFSEDNRCVPALLHSADK